MKNNSEKLRSILLQDVKNRLSKVFIDKGFVSTLLTDDELASELRQAFPLGRLKRKHCSQLHIVEFQFDKYNKLKFVVNFGIVPEGGVTLPWGDHIDQNVADVSSLSEAYRLYSSRFFMRWFELSLLSPKNERSIGSLVDKAINLSLEINDWFENQTIGKHMKKFGVN